MKFTIEMLEKAKTAKTAEELLELAKAENVEMTAEEAAKYFADMHKTGELSDEELDNVAGGCETRSPSGKARTPEEVQFMYWVGKYVEVIFNFYKDPSIENTTCAGTDAAEIIDREVGFYKGYYYPKYKVRYRSDQSEGWVWQNRIDCK